MWRKRFRHPLTTVFLCTVIGRLWQWRHQHHVCRLTWAMRASSCSLLSLDSFLLMKSLSVPLCWTLNSLQVSSMPRCSSFTSHNTFSRLTACRWGHAGEDTGEDTQVSVIEPDVFAAFWLVDRLTCSSLVDVVKLVVKQRHCRILLSHHVGDVMK